MAVAVMVVVMVTIVTEQAMAEVMVVTGKGACLGMLLTGLSCSVCPEHSPVSLREGPLSGGGRAGCGPRGPRRMFGGGWGSSTETQWTPRFLHLLRPEPDVTLCMGNHGQSSA